jgi:hypothetical protein
MAAPTTNSNVTRSISQVGQYIQELWTRDIQQPFDKILQMSKLVNDRSGLASGGGDTINVPCGTVVDDADILSVVNAFDTANTPQNLRRGVIGHNTKTDLLGVNKYVAYDQTGKTGQAVDGSDGLVGSLYGMDIYHSGNNPTTHNLFFHKSAITLIQQQAPKFEMEYVVRDIGWNTVLHTVYGVGVERSASVLDVTRTTAA